MYTVLQTTILVPIGPCNILSSLASLFQGKPYLSLVCSIIMYILLTQSLGSDHKNLDSLVELIALNFLLRYTFLCFCLDLINSQCETPLCICP
jgi:hypothetical protein